MRRCVVLLALGLAACGGPDRETFLSEANAVCRDRAASQDALSALPAEELIPAQTKVYEAGLEQVRALQPPEAYADAHAEWVEATAAEVATWKRYAADPDDGAARRRVLRAFEESAQVADRIGLTECDS